MVKNLFMKQISLDVVIILWWLFAKQRNMKAIKSSVKNAEDLFIFLG